jgi:hypothetical protein
MGQGRGRAKTVNNSENTRFFIALNRLAIPKKTPGGGGQDFKRVFP